MERIEPIRRKEESPWVAPAAPMPRVERRESADERQQQQRRRRPRQETPDGHPDADGHIDVEA
jgi:hypothetical protein